MWRAGRGEVEGRPLGELCGGWEGRGETWVGLGEACLGPPGALGRALGEELGRPCRGEGCWARGEVEVVYALGEVAGLAKLGCG